MKVLGTGKVKVGAKPVAPGEGMVVGQSRNPQPAKQGSRVLIADKSRGIEDVGQQHVSRFIADPVQGQQLVTQLRAMCGRNSLVVKVELTKPGKDRSNRPRLATVKPSGPGFTVASRGATGRSCPGQTV